MRLGVCKAQTGYCKWREAISEHFGVTSVTSCMYVSDVSGENSFEQFLHCLFGPAAAVA